MKRILASSIILIFSISHALATKAYKAELDQSKYCSIDLYEDGTFDMELTDYLTIDMEFSALLSHGTYKLNEGVLYLSDKSNNLEMIFRKKGDSLIPVQTFLLLKNTVFQKDDDYIPYKKVSSDITIKTLNQKIIPFKEQDSCRPFSLTGMHYGGYGYRLILFTSTSNKYELWYRNLLFSAGNWSKDGNLLKMNDQYLNDTLIMGIDNKHHALKELFLPGSIAKYNKIYWPMPILRNPFWVNENQLYRTRNYYEGNSSVN